MECQQVSESGNSGSTELSIAELFLYVASPLIMTFIIIYANSCLIIQSAS